MRSLNGVNWDTHSTDTPLLPHTLKKKENTHKRIPETSSSLCIILRFSTLKSCWRRTKNACSFSTENPEVWYRTDKRAHAHTRAPDREFCWLVGICFCHWSQTRRTDCGHLRFLQPPQTCSKHGSYECALPQDGKTFFVL